MRKTAEHKLTCTRCRLPIQPGQEYHEVYHRLWTTNNFHTGCFYVVKPRADSDG